MILAGDTSGNLPHLSPRRSGHPDTDADAPPDTKDDHNKVEGSSAQAASEDTPALPSQEQAAEASETKWEPQASDYAPKYEKETKAGLQPDG